MAEPGVLGFRDGELPIDAEELQRRKDWLDFTDEDAERLRALGPVAAQYAEDVIEELYDHFLANPETAAFFKSAKDVERVKGFQREYFRSLTDGEYGLAYAAGRIKIGATHQRIGLDVKWYLGAYAFYVRAVTRRIMEAFDDPSDAFAVWHSLKKLMFLDIGLAVDNYIAAREHVIERQQRELREMTVRRQQEMIRELSTPVLQIRPGLLILPIIGAIDSQRAMMLTQTLLTAIRDRRASVVVIDITGVPAVDSAVANHLVQTVDACRLMGAAAIVTGLSPEVAQTLALLGVDLAKLRTLGDLEQGIRAAERVLADGPVAPEFD